VHRHTAMVANKAAHLIAPPAGAAASGSRRFWQRRDSVPAGFPGRFPRGMQRPRQSRILDHRGSVGFGHLADLPGDSTWPSLTTWASSERSSSERNVTILRRYGSPQLAGDVESALAMFCAMTSLRPICACRQEAAMAGDLKRSMAVRSAYEGQPLPTASLKSCWLGCRSRSPPRSPSGSRRPSSFGLRG
jgi:hypothetical protein